MTPPRVEFRNWMDGEIPVVNQLCVRAPTDNPPNLGAEVLVVACVKHGIVFSLGSGIYAANEPYHHDEIVASAYTARITLNSFGSVYGHECIWGEDRQVRKLFQAPEWEWRAVTLNDDITQLIIDAITKTLEERGYIEEASAFRLAAIAERQNVPVVWYKYDHLLRKIRRSF